jgi:hypothetical protein
MFLRGVKTKAGDEDSKQSRGGEGLHMQTDYRE